MLKNIIILGSLASASVLNAQSFVAGWDFDGVNAAAASATANWGDLSSSATASWTHSPANPPFVWVAEFGIDTAFNSAVVGNTFAFIDPNTGFDEFSDNVSGGEYGFESKTAGESMTFSFDASAYTGLSLSYAVDLAGDGSWATASADLSSFDGIANASFVLNTANGARYDNFAITGSAIPEPSAFAIISGVLAMAFVAVRRRK